MSLSKTLRWCLRPLTVPVRAVIAVVGYWSRRTWRALTGRSKTLLVFPPMPAGTPFTIRLIAHYQGYRIIGNPSESADLTVYWENATTRQPPYWMCPEKRGTIINYHSRDISKTHISHVFEEVFGYPVLVDPFTFHGLAVCKPDANAAGKGTVVQCPITEAKPDYIYQKLVKHQVGEGRIEELRIPVIDGDIPYLYAKQRPAENHIEERCLCARVALPHEVLSEDEITKIREFVRRLGLDLAELDAARNSEDGNIYIFDANQTPTFWNGGGLSIYQRRAAQMQLASFFEERYFTKTP